MTKFPGMPSLPRAGKVNVSCLEGLFSKTTNSYKYVFLKAVIESVCSSGEDSGPVRLEVRDLRDEMLLLSWFPTAAFKLNFGSTDMTGRGVELVRDRLLDGADIDGIGQARDAMRENREEVQELMAANGVRLTRYVIFKLLTPWFHDILQRSGRTHWERSGMIRQLSRERFGELKPLYRIEEGDGAITVHPDWVAYLRENMGVVRGWLDMQWLTYLQGRNPNVPNLARKLWIPPPQRTQLGRQKNFWLPAVREGFRCIYTGETVPASGFALDHFIPWRWIGHDQLWNLVPVSSEVNSSKGALLPALGLVEDLAEAHVNAIDVNLRRSRFSGDRFEDYLSGLNVRIDRDLNPDLIRQSYRNNVLPQLQMAADRGFRTWNVQV